MRRDRPRQLGHAADPEDHHQSENSPVLHSTGARRSLHRARLPELVRVVAGHPVRLLVVSWALFLLLYYFGPVQYDQQIAASTWTFILFCGMAFSIGTVLTLHPLAGRRAAAPSTASDSTPKIDRIVRLSALLALIGCVALVTDKLFFSGLDYSQGITALRFEQDAQVIFDGRTEHSRSLLLYVGYITLGFSAVSYALCILKGETLNRTSVGCAHAGLIAPAAFSLLYGGRSPFALVLGLAGGAILVRMLRGMRSLPIGPLSRPLLIAVVTVYVGYCAYIFEDRRALQRVVTIEEFDARVLSQLDATIAPWVKSLMAIGWVDESTMMNLTTTVVYFTHELTILDRTLNYQGPLGPYYGQYQLYLGSVVLSRALPSLSYVDPIRTEAQDANLYGWFQTAWGQMYLDFGWIGALAFACLCGAVIGALYRRGLAPEEDLRSQLLLAYAIVGLAIIPIQSILSISIALQILCAILVCNYFLPPASVSRVLFPDRLRRQRYSRGGAVSTRAVIDTRR